MVQINLIPAEERVVFPLQLILVLLICLAIFLFVFLEINSRYGELKDLKTELALQEQQLSQAGAQLMAIHNELEQEFAGLSKFKQDLLASKHEYWVDLKLISSLAQENPDVSIRLIEMRQEQNNLLVMELMVNSLSQAGVFIEQLEAHNRYRQVELIQAEQRNIDQSYYLELLVWRSEVNA